MVNIRFIRTATRAQLLELANEIYNEETKLVNKGKMKKSHCVFKAPPKKFTRTLRQKIEMWYRGEIYETPYEALSVLSNVLNNQSKFQLGRTSRQFYETPQVQQARNRLYKDHVTYTKLKNLLLKIKRKIEAFYTGNAQSRYLRTSENEIILYFLFKNPGYQPINAVIPQEILNGNSNSNNNSMSKQDYLDILNLFVRHGYVEMKHMIKPVGKYNVVYNENRRRYVKKVQNTSPKLHYKLKYANRLKAEIQMPDI